MSKVEAMLPQLRFEIFGSEWEKTKLGQLVGIFRGLVYKPENVVRDGNADSIRVLRSSNIDEDVLVLREDDVFVQADAVNIENVKQGDILITAANGSSRLVGKHAVIKESLAKTVHGGFMLIARTDFPYFINAWMGAVEYQKMLQLAQGGNGAIGNLSKKILDNCEITLPKDIEEQTKIGELFQKLDRAIELQQQKVEQSERYKKAMLQKMFPQKGETEPQLRFEGFSGEWEARKIQSISEFTVGGGTPSTSIKEYWQGELSWIQSSDLKEDILYASPTKFITSEAIQNSAAKVVPAGSIAIVTRVGVGKLALIPHQFATSQDFLSLANLKINQLFALYSLFLLLQKEKHMTQGTSIKGITKAELLNKKIYVPMNISEQTKIGEFFQSLDVRIEVETKKLNYYESLKKAMLQRMFV